MLRVGVWEGGGRLAVYGGTHGRMEYPKRLGESESCRSVPVELHVLCTVVGEKVFAVSLEMTTSDYHRDRGSTPSLGHGVTGSETWVSHLLVVDGLVGVAWWVGGRTRIDSRYAWASIIRMLLVVADDPTR